MRVEKNSLKTVFFTDKFKITGQIYILPQERLTDFLTAGTSSFLPVTDAEIKTIDNDKIIAKTKFLNLNKNEVTIIYPAKDGEKG